MESITRGSAYLTDDFLQAMFSNDTVTIDSCKLLMLPDWKQNDGMFITAEELGMNAAIEDPNELLPNVFSRYWFNLCAHARKYHASIEDGYKIEDFSEQAFWKMLQKLTGKFECYVVAETSNVISNAANVDGNTYMEVLVSVDTTIPKQNFAFVNTKPTYLQAVSSLPTSYQPLVLGGHDRALYDTTFYDIQNDNCVRAEKTEDTDSYEIQFNAALLFYSNGDSVSQCAGIYFPNAFVQDSTTIWSLPVVTRGINEAYGMSLNFKLSATEYSQEYKAANADALLAMQTYTSVYSKMLAINSQMSAYVDRLNALQQQVNQLKALELIGKFKDIDTDLQNLKTQLATKFGGTVSPNKLLELFIAARDANNSLQLSLNLSDLSKAVTSRDIVVTTPVGEVYQKGDTINMGTEITTILEAILTNNVAPEYVMPTAMMRINGQIKYFVPYGYNSTVNLQAIVQQNDAGIFSSIRMQEIIAGTYGQYIDYYQEQTVYQFTQPIYSISGVQLTATYAAGALKLYPDGTPCYDGAIFGGTLYDTAYIIPTYNAFIYAIDVLEELSPTMDTSQFETVPSRELNSTYTSDKNYQCLFIPADTLQICTDPIANEIELTIQDMRYKGYAIEGNRMNINVSLVQ